MAKGSTSTTTTTTLNSTIFKDMKFVPLGKGRGACSELIVNNGGTVSGNPNQHTVAVYCEDARKFEKKQSGQLKAAGRLQNTIVSLDFITDSVNAKELIDLNEDEAARTYILLKGITCKPKKKKKSKQQKKLSQKSIVPTVRDEDDNPIPIRELSVDNVKQFTSLSDGTVVHADTQQPLQAEDGSAVKYDNSSSVQLHAHLLNLRVELGGATNKTKRYVKKNNSVAVRHQLDSGHDSELSDNEESKDDEEQEEEDNTKPFIVPTSAATLQRSEAKVSELHEANVGVLQKHYNSVAQNYLLDALDKMGARTSTAAGIRSHGQELKSMFNEVHKAYCNEHVEDINEEEVLLSLLTVYFNYHDRISLPLSVSDLTFLAIENRQSLSKRLSELRRPARQYVNVDGKPTKKRGIAKKKSSLFPDLDILREQLEAKVDEKRTAEQQTKLQDIIKRTLELREELSNLEDSMEVDEVLGSRITPSKYATKFARLKRVVDLTIRNKPLDLDTPASVLGDSTNDSQAGRVTAEKRKRQDEPVQCDEPQIKKQKTDDIIPDCNNPDVDEEGREWIHSSKVPPAGVDMFEQINDKRVLAVTYKGHKYYVHPDDIVL